VWDAATLYGGVGLFLAVAAGIVIRRTNYFVPVGALLAPVSGRLWNATRVAGGGVASVLRQPTTAPAVEGAAAQQRAPPDDSMWAESDWELDEEADATAADAASTADGAAPPAEEPTVDGQPPVSAGAAATADSRADDSVHSTAQSPAPRLSEPIVAPVFSEPAVGQSDDDDTASMQQPEQEAPTTVSAPEPEGAAEPAPVQGAARDAHRAHTRALDEQDEGSVAGDAAGSVPPAIAARLAEIEASYQAARDAVERATSAHEAALQRAAAVPPSSEAAAAAERAADAAAAEHSAAIAAAQAALREAAALQEAAHAEEGADEDIWDDAESNVEETAELDGQSQPVGSRKVPGADAGEDEAAEPAPVDGLPPAEPAAPPAPAMPAADSAVKHTAVDADSHEAAGAQSSSVPSSEEPASSSSSSATQGPGLNSAPASDPAPAAVMEVASSLTDADLSGMAAEPAVVVTNASSDPAEAGSTAGVEQSREREAVPHGAADAAEMAASEWRWEGSDEFPRGRWVER